MLICMKRVPAQAVLPFGVKEKVVNRQIRQRMEGKKVTRGPGRPRFPKGKRKVEHRSRGVVAPNTPVHVTVKCTDGVPNLRARKNFNVVKKAFVKFCVQGEGFRMVHFAVMSNHMHFVVEADSGRLLGRGMQRMLQSISRRLNAMSVRDAGGKVSTLGGACRKKE